MLTDISFQSFIDASDQKLAVVVRVIAVCKTVGTDAPRAENVAPKVGEF